MPSVRKTPKSIKALGINLVLVQEFFELIGIKIGQHFVACHKRGDITLRGKFFHVLVCLAVSTHINLLEAISFLAEIILCINTPRAPLATIKLQFHRQRANKREPRAASTDMRLIGPIRYIRSRCLVRFRPHDASRARFPVKMHSPDSEESSTGITRMVTLRSFLICSSISRDPFQCARAKPPWISGLARFSGVK